MDAMHGLSLSGESHQEILVQFIKAVKNKDVRMVEVMLSHYNMDPFETPPGSQPKERSREWEKIEDRHLEKNKPAEWATHDHPDWDCAGCAMMEAVNQDDPQMLRMLFGKVEVHNERHDEQILQVFRHSMDERKLHALAFLLKERSIPKTAPDLHTRTPLVLYAKRHRLMAPQYLIEKEENEPHFFEENWGHVNELVRQAEECERRVEQILSQPKADHEKSRHDPSRAGDDLWAQDAYRDHPSHAHDGLLRSWIGAVKQSSVSQVQEMTTRYGLDPFERPSGLDPSERPSGATRTPRGCAMMEAVRTQNTDVIGVLCNIPNAMLGGDEMLHVLKTGMDEHKLMSLAWIIMERPALAGLVDRKQGVDSLRSYAVDHGLWASEWLLGLALRQPGYLKQHWKHIGVVLDKAEKIAEEKVRSLNKRVQVPESEDARFAENGMWQIVIPSP